MRCELVLLLAVSFVLFFGRFESRKVFLFIFSCCVTKRGIESHQIPKGPSNLSITVAGRPASHSHNL
jgi:hypothetical protein